MRVRLNLSAIGLVLVFSIVASQGDSHLHPRLLAQLATLSLLLVLVVSGSTEAHRQSALNTTASVLYDMQPPSEGKPHGYGLVSPGLGYNVPPLGASQAAGWGQVFPDTSNTFPANVRVEIKNFETYIWSTSRRTWARVQAVRTPGGALYAYGFKTHIPADWRLEPDGGDSATMQSGYLLHFFPAVHADINRTDVGAVFTTVQARLIEGSTTGPNNLAAARFLLDMGCDWYGPNGFHVGVGRGRFVYLTPSWKAISFYTGGPSSVIATAKYPALAWTEAQLSASPPPMDGMGLP